MSSQRRSTVYDLASLRLHPDGSRVQQSSRNLRPRTSRQTTRDSRGNWIARDAAGSGTVQKRRRAAASSEDGESDGSGEEMNANAVRKDKGKQKEENTESDGHEDNSEASKPRGGNRAAKRLKFSHDLGFLETPVETPAKHSVPEHLSPPPKPSTLSLPLPSSDLLKSIHYLSSRYYSERGQLYDASKQFRKEKKERRRRRLGEQDKSTGDPHLDQDRGDEEEDQNEEPDSANEQANTKSRKGKEGKLRTKRGRDMYKRMDGSALMVIGMLLQEHVARLIQSKAPDGWEDLLAEASEEEMEKEVAADASSDDDSLAEEEDEGDDLVTENGGALIEERPEGASGSDDSGGEDTGSQGSEEDPENQSAGEPPASSIGDDGLESDGEHSSDEASMDSE